MSVEISKVGNLFLNSVNNFSFALSKSGITHFVSQFLLDKIILTEDLC